MHARSPISLSILVLLVAACGPIVSGGTATGAPPEVTPSNDPGDANTPTPTGPTTSPRASTEVVRNPDGSVWIGMPAGFGFAQPSEDAIWGVLTSPGGRFDVVRIDPVTYDVATVVGGLSHPVAPVTHNGSTWLASYEEGAEAGYVTQYDAETGKLIREIEVGAFPIEPVVAYGDVWTINHFADSVTRIDAATGEAHPPIELPGSHPLTITVVADDLMLVNGPETNPTTWLIDPNRMEMIGTFESSECFKAFGQIGAAIDGLLWRKRCGKDEIAIADPRTGRLLSSFASPASPYPPLYVDGAMWLPRGEAVGPGRVGLAALDPATHEAIATYEQSANVREGWWFAAFDSWWRWGEEGLLQVPAETLRAAAH